ncbi:MAG: hypothetical protein Kow0090_17100 [Myxococcota bacterium]
MTAIDREEIVNTVLKPFDMAVGGYIEAAKALGVYDKAQMMTYDAMRKLLKLQYTAMNELDVQGIENVPPQGGFLYASNHQSWLDVQILGASSPRRVHFIAKSEFKEWPVLRHLIELSDSVFVKRGGDNTAIEQVAEFLKKGKVVAIYPEGTIPGEEDIPRRAVDPRTGLLPGKTGAVRMAIKARVPIVPVGVSGTGRAFPPEIYPRLELLRMPGTTPVRIRFGKPIHYDRYYDKEPDKETFRKLTDELMQEISKLVDHRANYIPLEVPIPEPPKHEVIGVLLLHGFTSSLDCVNGLIPYLEQEKIPYRMPILRGHGTNYRDLRGVTHRHWYADAERALIDIWNEVDRIVVVGLSMGGLVALELGMNHPEKIAGVVAVAAALKFRDPLAGASKLLSKVVKYWDSPESFNDKELAKKSTNYPKFATDSFASLYEYSKIIASRLSELHVPIRILQSKADQIIAPESANIIYEKVSSRIREIVWFKKSGHEMMMDMEAESVFKEIIEFTLKFRKTPETPLRG